MVAIVTGASLGLGRTSVAELGSAGELGPEGQAGYSSNVGLFGENVYVNAANGNLVVERTDEYLAGVGLDDDLTSVYNSLTPPTGGAGYGANQGWQTGDSATVWGLSGSYGTSGSSVYFTGSDGTIYTYNWNATDSAYVCTQAGNAANRLTLSGSTWDLWNGQTDVNSYFDNSNGGRITSTVDSYGNSLTYSYNSSNQLVEVQSSDGEYTQLNYTSGNLTNVTTYYFASAAAKGTSTYSTLSDVTYGYNTSNLLTTVTTQTSGGNSVTITYGYTNYGGTNYVTSISQTGGEQLAIGYTQVGSSYLVTSVAQTTASGVTNTTTFGYNTSTNQTTITDNAGNETVLTYDSLGQLDNVLMPAAQSGATQHSITYDYNSDGDVTDIYDAVTSTQTNHTHYTYDANDNLLTVSDPLYEAGTTGGSMITYTYDSSNHMLTATTTPYGSSASSTIRYVYNSDEKLRFVITDNGTAPDGSDYGMVTQYIYSNTTGLLTNTYTYPNDSYVLTGIPSSDSVSLSAMETWAGGLTDLSTVQETVYTYDYRGNLATETTYSENNSSGVGEIGHPYTQVTYVYDQSGNLLSKVTYDGTSASYTSTYVYDGLNRLISESDPDGNTTTIAYSDSTDATTVTLGNGLTTVDTYNLAGQLISSVQSGTDTVSATTTYTYDDRGNLCAVTDPNGNTTYYLYDNLDRQVAVVSSDGDMTRTFYTADNLVAATVSYATQLTTTEMDAIEAVSSGELADPALSTVLPGTSSSDVWNWNIYDADNRLIETINGGGFATVYTYDGYSNVISTTEYSNALAVSGFKTTLPTTLQLPTANATVDRTTQSFYDDEGQLVGTINALGYVTQNIYNNSGQLIQTTAYANEPSTTTGAFSTIVGSITTSSSDRTTMYFYDNRGLMLFSVDANLVPTEYVYDDAGNLTETIRFDGSIASSTSGYTLSYVQSQVTTAPLDTAATEKTWYVYDPTTGQLDFEIDALGDVTGYTYNAQGQVIQQTRFLTQDAVTSLPSLSTMQTWASANATGAEVTSSVYNIAGQLAYSIDAVGDVTQYQYDADGHVIQQTQFATQDPVTSSPTEAAMDAWVGSGSGSNAVNPLNEVTQYVYDDDGRVAYTLTSLTYTGSTVDYAVTGNLYNSLGQLIAQTQYTVANSQSALPPTPPSLSAMGTWLTANGDAGNTTYYFYDVLGDLTLEVDPDGYATGTTYTFAKQVATVKHYYTAVTVTTPGTLPTLHPNATYDATTTFAYDQMGQLLTENDAADYYTQTYTYDAFGDQLSASNKVGGVVYYTYDNLGRVLSEQLPEAIDNGTTQVSSTVTNTYAYDSFGNMLTMNEEMLPIIGSSPAVYRTTTYTYNALNRLHTVSNSVTTTNTTTFATTSNVTATTTYSYNAFGNINKTVDPNANTTYYYYDGLNRQVAEVNAVRALTVTTYDAFGNVASQTAYAVEIPTGDTISATTPLSTLETDAGGSSTTNSQTTYTYDLNNRLVGTSLADVQTGYWNGTSYSITTSTSSIVTSNVYDNFGNLIQATDGNGNTTNYYYDADGNKIGEVDPDGYITIYTVDDNGNVTNERQYYDLASSTPAAGTNTVAGLQACVTATSSDRTTTFTYDLDGNRLTETRDNVQTSVVSGDSVTTTNVNSIVTYTYNGLGEVLTVTQATGDETTYTYDTMGRLLTTEQSAFTNAGGTSSQYLVTNYYDGLNDLVESVQSDALDTSTPSRATTYTYYSNGWLESETDATGFTQTYGYDKNGNTVAVTYALAQPNAANTDAPVAAINTAIVYTYDGLNRQLSQKAGTESGTTWSYLDKYQTAYNAFGQVASESVNSVTQQSFVYDNAGQVTATVTGNGSMELLMYDADGNETMALTPTDGTLPGTETWPTLTMAQALSILTPSGDAIGTFDGTSQGVVMSFTTYDARDKVLSTVQPFRQLTSTTTATLTTSQTYDAFGDVLTQTDANGHTTTYTYTRLGNVMTMTQPSVAYPTATGGTIATGSGSPVTDYYYDGSGREVGTKDPNGYTTTETLLANSGYNGSKALVVTEYYPVTSDSTSNGYDVFGDVATSTDGDGYVTTYTYDAMGRLTQENMPARPAHSPGNTGSTALQLIDYYAYDGLGERIESWNNELSHVVSGTSVPYMSTTTYDAEGRDIQDVDLNQAATTYSYVWSSSIVDAEGVTTGGWVKTTTTAYGMTATETDDVFGNKISLADATLYGDASTFYYTYDAAGRLTEQTIPDSSPPPYTTVINNDTTYTYYNTGNVASEENHYYAFHNHTSQIYHNTISLTSTYTYDKNGNRLTETLTGYSKTGVNQNIVTTSYENATATYDALNRMSTLSDSGNDAAAPITIAWSYDKDSNVIQQDSTYYGLTNSGTQSTTQTTQDYWYEYDSLNRVVLDNGVEQSGAVVQGMSGTTYSYDDDNRRITSNVTLETPSGSQYKYQEQLETYTYTPDGYVAQTNMAVGALSSASSTYITPPSISTTAATASGTLQSTYLMDAMGRDTTVAEYTWSGSTQTTVYTKTATYDNDSNVLSDSIYTLRSNGQNVTQTDTYSYDSYDYTTETFTGAYQGNQATLINTSVSVNGGTAVNSETENYYGWEDGSYILLGIDYFPNTANMSTVYETTFNFNTWQQMASASVDAGTDYTNNYIVNLDNEIVSNISTAGPASEYYEFDGVQEGVVTNNGTTNVDYAQSIASQQAVPGSGYFANGATTGTPFAAFGTTSNQIDAQSVNANAPTYTVQSGDTMESIAQALWGDSSYWYLIADANGIQSDSQLFTGENLTIPTLESNDQNTASTNSVYNETQALGNVSPTHPPPASHSGCGIIGEIILVIIAAVVTYFTAGALAPEMGVLLGSAFAGGVAAGAIGAIAGSIVSQGVGLATGIQSKFNWAAVGEAAIGGAVGGGVAASDAFSGLDLGSFGTGVLQGVTGSVVSQGIDVATGLQSKFNWADVAEAGVSQGVSGAVEANSTFLGSNVTPTSTEAVFVGGMAGAIAGAATKTALGDGSFGDNFAQAIPGAIGDTIGAAIENNPDLFDDDGPTPYQLRMSDAPAQAWMPTNAGQFTAEPLVPETLNMSLSWPSSIFSLDSDTSSSTTSSTAQSNSGTSGGASGGAFYNGVVGGLSSNLNFDVTVGDSLDLNTNPVAAPQTEADGSPIETVTVTAARLSPEELALWAVFYGVENAASAIGNAIVSPANAAGARQQGVPVAQKFGSSENLPMIINKDGSVLTPAQMFKDIEIYKGTATAEFWESFVPLSGSSDGKVPQEDAPSEGGEAGGTEQPANQAMTAEPDFLQTPTAKYFMGLPANSPASQDFWNFANDVVSPFPYSWTGEPQTEARLYADVGFPPPPTPK